MAVVRILVDGFSLLRDRPVLAAGRPRHSATARDQLAPVLARPGDAIHTPIGVTFTQGEFRRPFQPHHRRERERFRQSH